MFTSSDDHTRSIIISSQPLRAMEAAKRRKTCASEREAYAAKTAAVGWAIRVTRGAYMYAVGSPIGGLVVAWPVHSLIVFVAPKLQRVTECVDFCLDVASAMGSAATERVYASLPRTVKLCVDEFLWARDEFEKQFEKRLPRQKRQQLAQQHQYQYQRKADAAGGDGSSSTDAAVMDIDNVLQIISVSREAFTAVVTSKDAHTTATAAANTPVAFEPIRAECVSIHGLWQLDVARSEPWDALFDVLGIAKRSTVVRPAMQEFIQEDGNIGHRIFSASGKPRESTPKLFSIGNRAIAEKQKQGEGETIYTRYFFSHDGATLIQEACNPDKDVTVVTSRSLEDDNTMIQTSEARKGDKHATVTRVFVRAPQFVT